MPTYRTLNLTDNSVKYVTATNKAQARSHVARKIIQVEVADAAQIFEDAANKVNLVTEDASAE